MRRVVVGESEEGRGTYLPRQAVSEAGMWRRRGELHHRPEEQREVMCSLYCSRGREKFSVFGKGKEK